MGISGKVVSPIPVASRIALRIAGATPNMAALPAPAEGRSLRSIVTISIFGISLNPGTLYSERLALSIFHRQKFFNSVYGMIR